MWRDAGADTLTIPSTDPSVKEPIVNLPWQPLALGLALVLAFAAQLGFGGGDPEAAARVMGLTPRDLWSNGGSGVFTHLLVHGSWTHLALSAAMTVVLGTPMARRMPGIRGFLGLVTFFLICGATGGVAFAALDADSQDMLIGASGAVSGLLAAAARLARRRQGVEPLWSPLLIAIGAVWLVGNALAAFTQFAGPSAFSQYGWQAHVGGFIAGALLTGTWVRLFGDDSERLRPARS